MSYIKFPGLIDMHVHLRDPGQTQKEDFYTGTSAALAGGFTKVFDMPNNREPVTSEDRLIRKIREAKSKVVCDVGFYFGSLGDNLEEFVKVKDLVFGLKLYLNITTGGYIIDVPKLNEIYRKWNKVTGGTRPILLHAEEDVLPTVFKIVEDTKHPTHICHVSSESELSQIIAAKEKGLPVTCGVCPHHLFLTREDVKTLGPFGLMKLELKSRKDQEFLWKHLSDIDVVESDHAPHTIDEKKSDNPPFGVPGLETTLPLLITAVHEDRLTVEEIIRLCHTNPAKILNLTPDKDTYVEILNTKYQILNTNLFTKCKWSPFDGWKVYGKVQKVYIRGQKVFENGKVLAKQGRGRVINP